MIRAHWSTSIMMLLTHMFDISSGGDTRWILVWKGNRAWEWTWPWGGMTLAMGRHDLVDASVTGVLHKTLRITTLKDTFGRAVLPQFIILLFLNPKWDTMNGTLSLCTNFTFVSRVTENLFTWQIRIKGLSGIHTPRDSESWGCLPTWRRESKCL